MRGPNAGELATRPPSAGDDSHPKEGATGSPRGRLEGLCGAYIETQLGDDFCCSSWPVENVGHPRRLKVVHFGRLGLSAEPSIASATNGARGALALTGR